MDKKTKAILVDPLSANNPITYQVLGVCSSLAVTTQVKNAAIMAISLTLVTAGSNFVLSLMRNYIPGKIRMIVELAVISTLVIVVAEVLKAYAFDVHKQLSVFVGLIITNCIVMGRAEAYALQNPPPQSFLDGIGNGAGYSIILIIVSSIREILGNGSWYGLHILPSWYETNKMMALAPSAFIIIGMLVWSHRTFMTKRFETD